METEDVESLKAKLLDSSRPLFDRYRALFALRNINNEAAALALVEGFNDDSALFRHEIGKKEQGPRFGQG